MKKELLDHTLDDTFTNLFNEVKKSRENILVAVCVTDSKTTDKTRVSMHGGPDDVLAAICLAIHKYAEGTNQSITKVLLRITNALSEEE